MNILGKRINYIELHNFLSKIDAKTIQSKLHLWYDDLIKHYEVVGVIEWKGHKFKKEDLHEILEEEEGILSEIRFKNIPTENFKVTFCFESGNEYFALIKKEEQFAQIIQYLVDYGG
jgi:hypothetical protein